MKELSPIDWQKYKDRLNDLTEWLRAQGFDRPHRFELHRKNVLSLLDNPEVMRASLTPTKGHEFMWSICESLEFVEVLSRLQQSPPKDLSGVLRRALNGPVNPIEETQGNSDGRNFYFELVMAAHFLDAGFTVELAEPDIVASLDGVSIVIPCKRPLTKEGIPGLIRAGTRQGQKSLQSRGSGIQILALSATRIATSAFPDGPEPFETIDQMDRMLTQRIRDLIDHQVAPVFPHGEHHDLTAVLVHATFPVRIVNASDLKFTFREVMVITPLDASMARQLGLPELLSAIKPFF